MGIEVRPTGNIRWRHRLPPHLVRKFGRRYIAVNLRTSERHTALRMDHMFNVALTHLAESVEIRDLSLHEIAVALSRFQEWCSEAAFGWHDEQASSKREASDKARTVAESVLAALRENAVGDREFGQALSVFLTGALSTIAELSQRPIVVSDGDGTSLADGAGPKLSEIIDAHLREISTTRADQTVVIRRGVLSLFFRIVGDRPISQIRRPQIRHYKDTLKRLPPRFVHKFPKHSIAELLAMSQDQPHMNVSTINIYVGNVQTFFQWAYDNGYVDQNPAMRLKIRVFQRKSARRSALSRDDLKRIFEAGPLHSGLGDATGRSWHGNWLVREHYYWFPLVALFSGLRLEELATLQTDEIGPVDGVWCFDIKETEWRRLKSPWSERLVPVHPELSRVGFGDYVANLRDRGVRRLWPEVFPGDRGRCAQQFSRFWIRYRRSLGIDSPKKPFYSFRHTFISAMRDQFTPRDLVAELVGNRVASQEPYLSYAERSRPSILAEFVNKLDYGIDLSHLHTPIDRSPSGGQVPVAIREIISGPKGGP